MKIKYEKASLTDVDSIVSMQKELNSMLNLQDLDEIEFKKYIQSDILNKDKTYFVAKVDGETIGVICVDFIEMIGVDDVDYSAAIDLIYVNEKFRLGTVGYNLFMLAIEEMRKRDKESFVMSVEDNNPNKFLHFALADVLIEENEEFTQDGTTTQYLLGVTDIDKVKSYTFKEIMRKSIKMKKEFDEVLKNIPRAQTIAYLF